MFNKATYKTEAEVAAYIGKAAAKNMGYKQLNGVSFPHKQEYQLLCMTAPDKQNMYLNLFIQSNGDQWKVSAIGIAVLETCFTELTEEEAEKLWKFGTAYTHDNMCISMCDISGVDINTVCSYATFDMPPEKVIIDKSVTSKRKTISGIIQDWFSLQESIKNGDIKEDSAAIADYINTRSIRTEVVDILADACMYTKKCQKRHVGWQGEGLEAKAKVSLLGFDNSVYELYLIVDEVHTALFYLANENGQWVKKLLPDIIGDVVQLFIKKG